MADYSGYFLKGLGQGLQTGVNLGTQIQEMQWQKKQRKALEEKQAKMTEVSNLWNAKIKEIYADNKATDEEISQLTTIYLSGGYEFMDHYQGAMNAITSMNEKAYNREMEWMDLFANMTEGLPSGDIQAAFDIITPYVKSEKGRNTLEAYSNLQKKKAEARPEVFPTAGGVQEAYPEAGVKYTEKGYVPTIAEKTEAKGATMADEKSAITILKLFVSASPEIFEKKKAELEQSKGLDLSAYTQDILRESGSELANLYNTPSEVMANVKAPEGLIVVPSRDSKTGKYYGTFQKKTTPTPTSETVTTLKNWEKMFDIKAEEGPKTEEEYNRALNLLTQSKDEYKPQHASWKEALIVEVKGIGKELKGITDKGDYNLLLNIYMQKLEEIKTKYPDVDLNQFPEFEEQKNWFEKLKEKVGL